MPTVSIRQAVPQFALTNERGRLLQIVIDHTVQKAEKLCDENTSQANIKAKNAGTMLPHSHTLTRSS